MKVYKKELLNEVFVQLDETNIKVGKKHVVSVIDTFLKTITNTLDNGDNVTIAKFGTFDTRQRKARKMSHPVTKAQIDVSEATIPVFRPSKSLKKRLN
jgi:DNA-binding protein HU-beta